MRIYCNNDWKFAPCFEDNMVKSEYETEHMEDVRIPHTVAETPFSCFDEHMYQMVSGYRKVLFAPKEWANKVVLLTFEGVAHEATLYVNEKKVNTHACGYTAFTTDISEFLHYGEENLLALKVDSTESLNVPPFGYVIDYLTYGGIYRDVYIEVKEAEYIQDVFCYSSLQYPKDATLVAEYALSEKVLKTEGMSLCVTGTVSGEKQACFMKQFPVTGTQMKLELALEDIIYWEPENPQLYEITTTLKQGEQVYDSQTLSFGFREAVFRKEGFFLNGKKVKIRGLNRHQCYPYIGYAATKSLQEEDARILKEELGLNAVRTSHYPQSHYFLDACDRLGLLVFTEFPGWQHIGDEEWKRQAVTNVEEMIVQYRNHPSIILWGVRINESQDDDAFYATTNEVAHRLDPTRQTGGVRNIKKSHLLEDVYTYNDFVHNGSTAGCEPKKKVTSDMEKPYLISEYNGHMYPTKSYDCEEHRLEHALRHAKVLNDVAAQEDICGSFGWCMADYNTHKDFGSGDRVCHHGVLDMFRNPKMAAAVYHMQQEDLPVLKVSSSMDIGEHPGGNLGKVYLFTNADSVRMYKNGEFIQEFFKENTAYDSLEHGPILMDDVIGDALTRVEGYPRGKANALKKALNAVATYGLDRLPKRVIVHIALAAIRYGMDYKEAFSLYGKYIGNWGASTTSYTFEAIKDGKVVAKVRKEPMKEVRFITLTSGQHLVDGDTYDMAAIRVRSVDEHGNILHYCNEAITMKTEGPIQVVGPTCTSLKGGMGGTYIKTIGEAGIGTLTISMHGVPQIQLTFEVEVKK